MVPIITGKRPFCGGILGYIKLLRGQAKPNLLRRGLRVGLLFCFKILQGFEADVAVAVWILFQVLLVVFLGGIELFQREAFHRNGGLVFFLLLLQHGGNESPLCILRIINAGPVLAAPVVSLPVHRGGIDDFKVLANKRF